jgi:hypothetical protein
MPKKDATKAAFVRGLPDNMPAKDVVEKAKEAGLKLTTAYVYVIRSQARGGGKKRKNGASPRASKDAQVRLIAAASELGISRSIDLLTEEKARLTRLLR